MKTMATLGVFLLIGSFWFLVFLGITYIAERVDRRDRGRAESFKNHPSNYKRGERNGQPG